MKGPASALLAAAAILSAVPARAAAPAVKDVWDRVATPNFTIEGEVPAARLRLIGARLEAFRATLEWLHPGTHRSPRETTVYVFARSDSGAPFAPPETPGGHFGMNAPYDETNYVVLAAPDDDPPLAVLYHAYTHQFFEDNFPGLPLFVEEGLAELDMRFKVVPEGTLIGLASDDHPALLAQTPGWSIVSGFQADPGALRNGSESNRRLFVATSWALMHYLVIGSGERRAHVPAFLEGMQHGDTPEAASQRAFQVDLAVIQASVAKYVEEKHFPSLRTTDATVHVDASGFSSRSMPRDEVLAALGDLVAHRGHDRDADAKGYYDEALRLNPGRAQALAGLGRLAYARDRYADARPLFEKAVGLDDDAVSCYFLARSLLNLHEKEPASQPTPPWLDEARRMLERATTLRPGYAAPFVVLGSTHLRPDGDPAAGISALESAWRLLPARTDIAGNLVYLYLRTGDLARAQAMTDKVLAPSGDAHTLQAARTAIAVYKSDQSARRSASTAAIKGGDPDIKRAHDLENAKQMLAMATEPAARERLQQEVDRLESPDYIDPNQAVAIYNDAIAAANKHDYDKAIVLLEDLKKKNINKDLTAQIDTTLETLRKDAARSRGATQ
jgi:tetratricopeptide (TPR) repeat protein